METTDRGSLQMHPMEVKRYLATHPGVWLVDVRQPEEYEQAHLAGSRLVPLETLPEALADVPRDQDLMIYCASGGRSSHALAWARSAGFTKAKHMLGGIGAWYSLGLPIER